MSSSLRCVVLLFTLCLGAVAQTLTQHVGSTTCANSGTTLQYKGETNLRNCAAGTHSQWATVFTTVSCVSGHAKMQFWEDNQCTKPNGFTQLFDQKEYSKLRSGGCAKTLSRQASYRTAATTLPDCFTTSTQTSTTATIKVCSSGHDYQNRRRSLEKNCPSGYMPQGSRRRYSSDGNFGCCEANTCTCSDGTAATGPSCTSNSAEICASCNAGWTLVGSACQAYTCTTASSGSGCATCVAQSSRTTNDHCATCNSGYSVSGTSCQAYTCTTASSGSGCATCVAQSSRTTNDHCATCNSGYSVSGTSCQATCATYTCPIGYALQNSGSTSVSQVSCCQAYDCSVLEMSPNGPSHPNGCSGAVWMNGSPSKAYCEKEWWLACCQWEANHCIEKPGTATVVSTPTQKYDCTELPVSMNGLSHPSGCRGAVFSDGLPSQSYCEGKQGQFPWWSACCQWEGDACTEKEGTAVPVTSTTQYHNCATLPDSMNGASHPSGCPGAVWRNGDPSQSYCEGNQGKYPWWAACCQWSGIACESRQAAAGGRRLAPSNRSIASTILV